MNKEQQLPVMESFYTIQGEGAFTGSAAYFIRLGGCDVGCHWCDVKESWDADIHPKQSVEEIIKAAGSQGEKIVVITGGEPLMYDLSELTLALSKKGLRRHIETSGAHPLSGEWDWLCFSPKKFKDAKEEFYTSSHELKVIIYHKSDLNWAETHAKKMHKEAQLFLQPEWSRAKEMMPLIVEYVKNNPKWRVSLQTHKFMDIP
jgi:organic radical activating enzyme